MAAPQTFVITGVAGLIGSNMARYLLARGEGIRVIGIDNLSGGSRDNVPDGVEFHHLDLATEDGYEATGALLAPLRGSKWYLLHFAAYAAEVLSNHVRRFNADANIKATTGLVTLAVQHACTRFVFTSSMAIYGHGVPPFDEDTTLPCPADVYGAAKLFSETDLRIAKVQHGLSYCIVRPHNVAGPGVNLSDGYRNVLGIWMRQLLDDTPLTVFGDGSQRRAFTHVDDILPCLHAAAIAPAADGQTVNVGGTVDVAIAEAADVVLAIVGRGSKVFLPERHEAKHAWSTWAKSEALLGFRHTNSLADLVTDLWAWAQAQPRRPAQPPPTIELADGLPPHWLAAVQHETAQS